MHTIIFGRNSLTGVARLISYAGLLIISVLSLCLSDETFGLVLSSVLVGSAIAITITAFRNPISDYVLVTPFISLFLLIAAIVVALDANISQIALRLVLMSILLSEFLFSARVLRATNTLLNPRKGCALLFDLVLCGSLFVNIYPIEQNLNSAFFCLLLLKICLAAIFLLMPYIRQLTSYRKPIIMFNS
ncbi:hypothetical protein DBZ36_18175 [Alginatibacterium sediminis]|uniref:Uncharacterized protein n=1 Tax=Alginatibacterium sediminis TaxID=2164068 RepID=A0A420E6B8_9ALTE|nr:hypothetical protein [Alginatibacterium sediminis]RKF13699.1 hypothetical protein DBZ36_18175 [Alginatibacterium sediminis]